VPLGFWCAIALMGISAVLDVALAPRYAGGEKAEDGWTCQFLVVSLATNAALSVGLTLAHIGWITWHPAAISAVGAVVGTIGLVVRYSAVWALGRFFTWRVTLFTDHTIVRRGLFRYLRHPSYLGGMLAGWGVALALGNWLAFVIFSCTHVPLMIHRMRQEERALLAHFGDDYARYMSETARLVPFIY
jgi:protein-S-isoprenylcysteine O-methyltransferase